MVNCSHGSTPNGERCHVTALLDHTTCPASTFNRACGTWHSTYNWCNWLLLSRQYSKQQAMCENKLLIRQGNLIPKSPYLVRRFSSAPRPLSELRRALGNEWEGERKVVSFEVEQKGTFSTGVIPRLSSFTCTTVTATHLTKATKGNDLARVECLLEHRTKGECYLFIYFVCEVGAEQVERALASLGASSPPLGNSLTPNSCPSRTLRVHRCWWHLPGCGLAMLQF